MGTIKRERLEKRDFSDLHRMQLFTGHVYIDGGPDYGEGADFDEEAARADWLKYGPGLLAKWLAKCETPWRERKGGDLPPCDSLRPWAWWRYNAPATRPAKTAEAEYEFLRRHGLLIEGDDTRCDLLAQEQRFRREQTERYQAARQAC